jgi:hypothetical protein
VSCHRARRHVPATAAIRHCAPRKALLRRPDEVGCSVSGREGEEPERRNTLAQSRPAVAYPVNRYRLRFSRMRARTAGSGGGAVNRSPVTIS